MTMVMGCPQSKQGASIRTVFPGNRQRFEPSLGKPLLLAVNGHDVLGRQVVERRNGHDLIGLDVEEERVARSLDLVEQLPPWDGPRCGPP